MSGTSLDGIDGILTSFKKKHYTFHVPFPKKFKNDLLSLQSKGLNEIHREATASINLVKLYSKCVKMLLQKANIDKSQVKAIGAHGQTIRHQPEIGYSKQINNPSLLSELTGIDVISDFRSGDIAAGGQGAPLVSLFHKEFFNDSKFTIVILNIGGISNITILRPKSKVIGFDTGPGNILMDFWTYENQKKSFDKNGYWAKSGKVNKKLLNKMLKDPYFLRKPPKSTGRDLFNEFWLKEKLENFKYENPTNIQTTIAQLTIKSISDAIKKYAPLSKNIFVCGGGALNKYILQELKNETKINVCLTDTLGIPTQFVESMAFAWLAMRFCEGLTGNVPTVTGAKGKRILGSLSKTN